MHAVAVVLRNCLMLTTLGLLACSDDLAQGEQKNGGAKGAKAAPEPVITSAVTWAPQQTLVEAVGTSRARQSVTLYPEVAGEVVAILFRTGDPVVAGQPLVQLDARDETLAVELARVELAEAQRLFSRYQRSEGAGAVTASTLDEAKSAVERARIALERAQVDLTYRTVTAPFAGHVGLTTLDVGARVDPTTPLVTLDDRSQLLITFPVPELFYGQVQNQQRLQVGTWANGSEAREGEVIDVDSRVDPQNRTFTVRAQVPNTDDELRPGMSFRVQLPLQGGRYPLIPEVALSWGGDGAYVWAVRDGLAQRVPATIVQRLAGKILVEADLPDGTLVVSEGVQRLREGQPVTDVADQFVEAQP